jgi:DNA-binding MarR family transcriptional regulator
MQKSYYAIIPANVRYDSNLTASAKLVYGELATMCNEFGICKTNNQKIAELYGLSKVTISKNINQLEKNKYIDIRENCQNVKDLKRKNLKGLGYGTEICEWCSVSTSVLHSHHFPIPKSKGGIKTVKICPNCHHEFHYSDKEIKLILSSEELRSLNEEKKRVERGDLIGKSI